MGLLFFGIFIINYYIGILPRYAYGLVTYMPYALKYAIYIFHTIAYT